MLFHRSFLDVEFGALVRFLTIYRILSNVGLDEII